VLSNAYVCANINLTVIGYLPIFKYKYITSAFLYIFHNIITGKYLRCFWHPSTFSGQSQEWVFSLYNNPPMHSCSVAVLFQQVQYRVQDVSWPNIPYSQSQCSRAIGPSVGRNTNGYNNIDRQLPWYQNFKTYGHIRLSKGPHPVNHKLCINVQTTNLQTQHLKPKMPTITAIQLYLQSWTPLKIRQKHVHLQM